MALPGCIVSPLVSAIGLPQNLAVRSRARSRHISYASVELVDGYRQLSVTVFHRLLHSNHCRTTVTLYRTLTSVSPCSKFLLGHSYDNGVFMISCVGCLLRSRAAVRT